MFSPTYMHHSSSSATLFDAIMSTDQLANSKFCRESPLVESQLPELDSVPLHVTKRPLHLLDLPIDILKEIIDQVALPLLEKLFGIPLLILLAPSRK